MGQSQGARKKEANRARVSDFQLPSAHPELVEGLLLERNT